MDSSHDQTSDESAAPIPTLSSFAYDAPLPFPELEKLIRSKRGRVVAWHKSPTTADIQEGVESAIESVIHEAGIPSNRVLSLRIGTTQFVNAVLEQDGSKLDKVAVIRLCGKYTKGSPPFSDFSQELRNLVAGYSAFVGGGYEVDGRPISKLDHTELRHQASIIKSKNIRSVVVVGIYSPSNPEQELEAAEILSSELGHTFDVSCSHRVGRLGFLERENASILNSSLRRFARHVINSYDIAARRLGNCKLYITFNDGTLSKASEASEFPIKCFASGPTNSARGAAYLSQQDRKLITDDSEVLVVDVGGTTTDICVLTESGFPRQSAAFVRIAGVRTNFTIPDVHSIAVGGGSLVRNFDGRTTVGPESVAFNIEKEAIYFGGTTLTATDLVLHNELTKAIPSDTKRAGIAEVERLITEAIDFVKTKRGDATVILVGGGVIIIQDDISGVGKLLRPDHYQVANAIGAAIGKVSGSVDIVAIPGLKTVHEQLEEAKQLAIARCVAAGGSRATAEVTEVDVVPISYVTNGATRLMVRAISELIEDSGIEQPVDKVHSTLQIPDFQPIKDDISWEAPANRALKGPILRIPRDDDVRAYKPDIRGDFWYLSETDLQFLQDGAGVLGVGSCGEAYPTYIACLQELQKGRNIIIQRQSSICDEQTVLVGGFMGSPSVYLERVPGESEITNAIDAVVAAANISSFHAIIPNEIGGMNAFEALLTASRLNKTTLDTDCVARAYPYLWQTVRYLRHVPITPAAVADATGRTKILKDSKDGYEAEDAMRDACTDLGSLAGICVNPVTGREARTLPPNSFSYAWTIGRSMAISRCMKCDPARDLVKNHGGALLFSGKIMSVSRRITGAFTRGDVVVVPFTDDLVDDCSLASKSSSLFVEFENENLCATLRQHGEEDRILAVCPDLITFLDHANGAPLGVSDYKYGFRVNVIALKAPTIWTTDRGLQIGGPAAFGLDVKYHPVVSEEYQPPKSVWELF